MRLFHVSEENNILNFEPRPPKRVDLNSDIGLVWAVDDKRLPNFLTPRDCPRVTFHIGKNTTQEDINYYFTSNNQSYVVVLEKDWYEIILNTTLYVYEFSTEDFVLQDEVAGYYVSTKSQIPIAKYCFKNLLNELFKRNVEVRFVDNLWDIAEKIKDSTLNWSLCRMNNAKHK